MQDRRGEIGSADATSSISPKVFLFASFLELSNQLLAVVLAQGASPQLRPLWREPPVEDREAAYLAALGRFPSSASLRRDRWGKWQIARAGGQSCLNKARSAFSVSAGVMFPVGSIPYRGAFPLHLIGYEPISTLTSAISEEEVNYQR